MKVRDAFYIPTYEYNYKVITRCDTMLYEYYINDSANTRIQRDIQWWIVQNDLTSYKRKIRGTSRGPGRIRSRTGLPLIHYASAAPLWSTGCPSRFKLWDLNMQIQGSQNLPNEWCDECRVACIDKNTCIDKSESKTCIENRVVSTYTRTWKRHQVMRCIKVTKLVVRA